VVVYEGWHANQYSAWDRGQLSLEAALAGSDTEPGRQVISSEAV